MNHVNLSSYEGVEKIDRFGHDEFINYCNDKLASCDKHVKFIKELFSNCYRPLRVLEIGSGSGKLLYRLEQEGVLECGVGYEVSFSRCLFAHHFGRHVKSEKVEIRHEDFCVSELPTQSFDLIIGVDVVINLISAISSNHQDLLIRKSMDALAPGGKLVLEFMTCAPEIDMILRSEGGIYKTWKTFPVSDPFSFGLDEISLDPEGNVVYRKIFLSRDGGSSEFTNIIKPISIDEIKCWANRHKLCSQILPHWTPNDDTLDQEFIAIMNT